MQPQEKNIGSKSLGKHVKVDGDMLWPFFEGNQRSVKCIAAYIESFPCGKPAGYKLESQRCIKSSSRSKGMFLAQNTALSPMVGV